MKIKFVVESIKKIESDGSLSVQNLMNILQNGVQQVTGTKTGDCYEFRLLYPYYQDDKVSHDKRIQRYFYSQFQTISI